MASIHDQKEHFSQRTIAPQDLQHLCTQLRGRALVPDDDDYDNVRSPWDTVNFDQYPALVVLPANTADACVAVTFARTHHLPIAVRSGGHGHIAPANGALLMNFAQMTAIHINQEASTVRVEPGVKIGDLVQAAHAFGLAPLNGTASTVGVGGYMLGVGTGWLARQYGPGSGSIRSLEVVTVDGQVLQVHETSHPDLFWGLRGGGGNFGIVTSLELTLYPVKEVFGGQVLYPVADGKRVINEYLEWVKTVPDELTSMLRIMHYPPVPEVAEVLHGKPVISILACYNGPASTAETVLRPIRTLVTPILDTFASMPYSRIATIANDAVEPPRFCFILQQLPFSKSYL
jgi:FAD/FMN-containing dehydrogenase